MSATPQQRGFHQVRADMDVATVAAHWRRRGRPTDRGACPTTLQRGRVEPPSASWGACGGSHSLGAALLSCVGPA